jgi:hypothetical protein
MTDWFARPVLHVSSVEAGNQLFFNYAHEPSQANE